jgi:DNA invertase Pin-like site-specific DNA recombinase
VHEQEGENMHNIYGYVRVSSKDQNENRQLDAMKDMKIPEKNVYVDKQSGKDFDRPQYNSLMKKIRENDLICILSIDRLGRDYEEIQKQWRYITKEKKVDIVVLDMPLLDTRRGKDLMGTFLADIVLQVLSFVAETERKNIRQRQAEGIAAAKARGVKFGRPRKPLPDNFEEVFRKWSERKLSNREAARALNMSLSGFRYRAKIYEKENVHTAVL